MKPPAAPPRPRWYHVLFWWNGKLGRGPFLAWGAALFIFKYNLDRILAYQWAGISWYPTDYLRVVMDFSLQQLPEKQLGFLVGLLILSMPFTYIGIALCIKRLRDAALPPQLVVLFCLPPLNLALFLLLGAFPGRADAAPVAPATTFPAWLVRLMPTTRLGAALVAVALAVVLLVPGALFSIYVLQTYGVALFVGIPFLLGATSTVLASSRQPLTLGQSIGVACTAVLLFGLVLLISAVEGVICLLMALPLALPIGALGGLVAYRLMQPKGLPPSLLSLTLFLPLLLGLAVAPTPPATLQLVTEVEVKAPPEAVWDALVAFSPLPPPTELPFLLGISYPVRAEITGGGVGATRRCRFNAGDFVEPITTWQPPRRLAFSVAAQPDPLTELSPYGKLDAPHLRGFFASDSGQFRLTPTGNGATLLAGTTWYHYQLQPAPYWQLWTNYLLHTIHLRVLQHIKTQAELAVAGHPKG